MQQNLPNKILDVLEGTEQKVPPIWFMRQAGRHLPEYLQVRQTCKDFIDFCFTPEKASQVTLQPIERYDMDAAILFADILLIPIGLGRSVKFIKCTGPVLDPITIGDIARLTPDKAAQIISPVYETVALTRKNLSSEKALIGFCGGPWTVATYMIEGKGSPNKEIAKRFAYENPEAMQDLLQALIDSSAQYLIEQARAGADVLKIFESWAEGLSPDLFETLVIKPTRAIIKIIRDHNIHVPIIGFPRGAGLNAARYAHKTGITALATGTQMPMDDLRKLIPENMPVQGNLDPLALRIGGDTLRRAVDNVLESSAGGPHIFNLGHGVTPDVKIANVQAVVNHIRGKEAHYV